jgi:hypothetical protein
VEVTATSIGYRSLGKGGVTHILQVVVNRASIELLAAGDGTGKRGKFTELVNVVNRSTPHLPYVWVRREEAAPADCIEITPANCKVPRW